MWNRETCGSIVILLGSDQPDSSKWCDEQTMKAQLRRFATVRQLWNGNDVHGSGAFVDSARRPCQKYSSCDGGPCCH